ncbi:hydroxyacid dehydrogenase [Brachybacterium avium]|uniref:Hydroxyacid dehydrogenase n=1 Tax=Brachybacterium avium TaxID=2017485 RepID=A0A220UC35_9MICO|nr:hydroxyacid dehydrogenase [Brachybacterium avium]ASK65635.1 hydroxyacid dehydrogenase [Brachybacterium avium]
MRRLLMAMTPERALDVCHPATRALIEEEFATTWASAGLDESELRTLLPGQDIVVTSWGTPRLPTDLLGTDRGGPSIIAHAAGTIKNLVPPESLEDVTVFSAAPRIATSVGEYCLSAVLTLTRHLIESNDDVVHGRWKSDRPSGGELTGRRVGIVGASSTAREFIRLLAPFRTEITVHDPFLSPARAEQLGVRLASLEEVMDNEIVSVHVPATPATEGMITAELIAAIPDGAIVLNSSRAAAVDTTALLEAAVSGRLLVGLDVYDVEPPQLAESLAQVPGLLLTPHIAGDTSDGHRALTGYVLADVSDYLASGRRGPSWVDPTALSILA